MRIQHPGYNAVVELSDKTDSLVFVCVCLYVCVSVRMDESHLAFALYSQINTALIKSRKNANCFVFVCVCVCAIIYSNVPKMHGLNGNVRSEKQCESCILLTTKATWYSLKRARRGTERRTNQKRPELCLCSVEQQKDDLLWRVMFEFILECVCLCKSGVGKV